MDIKFLKFLVDPLTKEELILKNEIIIKNQIEYGLLISKSNKYEITNGIPRFVSDDNYSENFGWQWNKWSTLQFEENNLNKPMEKHTHNMFFKITNWKNSDIENKYILDLGCGSGRFSDLIVSYKGTPILVDNSNAIDVAKNNLKPKTKNAIFIQCDILNLPFKESVVDNAFSIGVLHHTPDPKKGVLEAYRVLKNNGSFALSVYSKDSLYNFPIVHIWRKVFRTLKPIFGLSPAFFYSQFFGRINFYISRIHRYLTYPIRLIFPTIVLKDIEWSVLDTFDAITTSYQSGHTFDELYEWFKISNFKTITDGSWGVNVIGKK